MTSRCVVQAITQDVLLALVVHNDIPLSKYDSIFSVPSGALPVTEIHDGITTCLDGEE